MGGGVGGGRVVAGEDAGGGDEGGDGGEGGGGGEGQHMVISKAVSPLSPLRISGVASSSSADGEVERRSEVVAVPLLLARTEAL